MQQLSTPYFLKTEAEHSIKDFNGYNVFYFEPFNVNWTLLSWICFIVELRK